MTVTGLLIQDAYQTLVREITQSDRSNLDTVFAAWLSPKLMPDGTLTEIANDTANYRGAQQGYQHVAILGYATAVGHLSTSAEEALRTGLLRQAGREPIMENYPMPVCTDAIAVLGIALGAQKMGEPYRQAVSVWLQKFLPTSMNLEGIQEWQRCLFAVAEQLVADHALLKMSEDLEVADVRLALQANGLLGQCSEKSEADEAQTLALSKAETTTTIGFARAALRLTALDWIMRAVPITVPGRAQIQDVVRLLQRVPAGLRRWTWENESPTRGGIPRQWHIDNEYHVQNLLWFMFSPLFPDLKDEVYTVPVGHKKPRADLYIPSIKLIIEVKYLRAKDTMQKMIGEIAEDASLYLAGESDCEGIVPFIWDSSGRTQEHDFLMNGLRQIHGIKDAVVIPAPDSLLKARPKRLPTN